ncbi:MAG: hypothetical protein FGM57_00205 [Candidatus Taylorbacteria bacterium]|nr:hypothetical protein [Candidatus Taylorbacteria bacterium]
MSYGSSNYGYHGSYGSYGSHGQSLNYDAAASERLRIEAAKRERQRQERERAKQVLADLERKRDHAKLELSHHQTEARRLATEIEHDGRLLKDIEHILQGLLEKEHSLKAKVSDAGQELQKLEKEILEKRKESDNKTNTMKHLETQLQQLQHQLVAEKNEIFETGVQIQKLGVSMRQIETQKNKHELDAEHAKSERLYKEKDVDNKRRALGFLQQKQQHEVQEGIRLQQEIQKIEMEIKMVLPHTK